MSTAIAQAQDKKTLLSTMKEVTFFVAIYLYFIGFIYIYYFYDSFGIPLRSIDTPVYYFFVYSYNVMAGLQEMTWGAVLKQKPLWTLIIAIIGICAILMLLRRNKKKSIMMFGALVILFPFLFYLARATAKSDALRIRTGETAKEITFTFKKETSAKTSVRVLQSFISGKDEDDSTANSPTATRGPKSKTGKPADAKTVGTEGADAPKKDAELIALERFLQANARIDLKEETDGGITTNWPKLYLLTETSDHFYVILQPYLEGGTTLPYGYVYEIAKADILLSEIKIPEPQ
jgi:hypothetical protein